MELLMHHQQVHNRRIAVDLWDCQSGPEAAQEAPRDRQRDRKARNSELDRRFSKRLNEVFPENGKVKEDLKRWAHKLTAGEIDEAEFYTKFSEICGDRKQQIFTDMVAFLPFPEKRARLLKLHENLEAVSVASERDTGRIAEPRPPPEKLPQMEKEKEAAQKGGATSKKKKPKKVVIALL
jgi:hypothetical protein